MPWERAALWLSAHQAEALLAVAAASLVFLIISIVFLSVAISLKGRYRKLMFGCTGENLEALLNHYGDLIEQALEQLGQAKKRLNKAEQRLKMCVCGVGLLRYNAFQETGSDLSFSLALLDRHKNGVIITSIFGREESRCYGKPVVKGESSHFLSEEEKNALAEAIKNLR